MIRVLIADDHLVVREGLQLILGSQPGQGTTLTLTIPSNTIKA